MAINKNFVIKNGVQVNTNLIVGDSTTNKVGIGTTVPGYTLHVGGARGGIGATDLNITGVGTVKDLLVSGYSGFSSDVSVSGIVSAQSLAIGTTEIVDRGMRLSGIASLDATTTATIEEAIRVGPNSFSDLKVAGLSTFVGIASFLGGIDVDIRSGVSTFSAPVQFGISKIDGQAGLSSNYVAVGATVGFGTSAFFRDGASIFFGNDSDLRVHHDGSNSIIEDQGTGGLHIRGDAVAIQNAAGNESGIVFTQNGSVDIYFDNSKKVNTTSGGLYVTGITTFSDRINVLSGVSTFADSASLTFGTQGDLSIVHNGSNSIIKDSGTGALWIQSDAFAIQNAAGTESGLVFTENGSVDIYFDNSKKVETTSGGLNVTGITTFSDRINVVSGVSTFQDSASLTFGAQGDLSIVHNGSNSIIKENGTGALWIQGDAIAIQNAAGSETQAVFTADSSVDLYYDATKTFETTPQGINVSGVTTTNRLYVSGITTFLDDAVVNFGNSNDLSISHNGSNSIIKENGTGALWIQGDAIAIQNAAGNETQAVFTADGSVDLYHNNVKRLETTADGILVGSLSTIQGNGNASFAGIVTVGGNLNVTGDITYDEVSGRNLNISGISTFGSGNGGVSGLLVTGAGYVGGGATVGSHSGIITYYGDGGNLTGVTIGIGTTGDGSAGLHPVGYGVTYLEFKGAGFTTAYYDGNLGIATLCFQGGGGVGAAGTWTPEGSIGISTSKSVGINTTALNDPDVQGIGNSFQGLYIGNGMLMVDNALNGNHYIGTNFNGMMAGPVTINGVLTIDGNYVVV